MLLGIEHIYSVGLMGKGFYYANFRTLNLPSHFTDHAWLQITLLTFIIGPRLYNQNVSYLYRQNHELIHDLKHDQ